MGQQLFKIDIQNGNTNDTQLNTTDVSFDNKQENIHFFLPIEADEITISDTELLFIDKIREHIFRLTHSNELEKFDTDINHILSNEVFPPLKEYNDKVIEQIKHCLETQHQLHTSLTNKLKQDDDENVSVEDDLEDNEQISAFAIQSLTSILLILIKSAETNDSTIVQKIVTLTSQLCEKLPIRFSSKLSDNKLLYQSLQPIRDFLNELLLRNDTNIAIPVTKILLTLSIAQFSFKEILPLLARLIFDTENIYDVRRLFIQLNNTLTSLINSQEQETNFKSITDEQIKFLKSIGVYPNSELIQLNKKIFTGQFISSIILTHIDIHDQIHFNEQFNHNSFSFEFNLETFQILFHIIKQLNNIIKQNSNFVIVYMLNICLRLFNTHLNYLCAIQFNFHQNLLTYNETIRKILSESSPKNFDLSKFVSEEELKNWFELLLKLSDSQNEISEEASKAFVYLLNLRISSFTEKLSFMYRYIIENKSQILINHFISEFNKNETLLTWIGILHDENNNQLEKMTSWKILESFIEIYFNPSEQIDKERIEQIEKILSLFQKLLICQLLLPTGDDSNNQSINVPSSVVIQYLTSLFRHYSRAKESNLFNSALVGLCLMTKVNELFDFTTVEPIFAAILPLLSDYILQSLTKEDIILNNQNLIYWLIGKISFVMICGSPLDPLEIKHAEKLKLTILSGGYEKSISEISPYLSNLLNSNLSNYSQFKLKNSIEDSLSDKEFLMSVFNNTGNGAELITKMKMFIQEKKYLLQQSIEEQANHLVSAVYAIYIKHFDRINLAKIEFLQMNQRHTHSQLLSIFENANYARTILRTIKAEGGDYQEFYRQTINNALFLLLSIGKCDLIPMIPEETPSPSIELPPTKPHRFERQISRWSKAKHVLKLLRHLMQACIRFKKLMRKKQIRQQRINAETLLSRSIDQFIYKENHLELDELKKCLDRQYERAITRLITYRFFEKFIQNVVQSQSDTRVLTMLTIFIPMLRKSTLEWSYLENILNANLYLRNEIRNCYYSILHIILPYLLSSESIFSMQNIFNYLNLNYTSADLVSLSHNQLSQRLFSLCDVTSLRTKFLAYNWFRLFTLKLCQNIKLDQIKGKFDPILEQERYILCHSFIRNKLELNRTSQIEEKEYPFNSLKDLSFGWFNYILSRDSSIENSSKFEKDLLINEYLVLLLRCFHFYTHLRSICSTVSYIERLIDIYHQSEFKVTRILSLKILRQLIPYLPNYTNDRSKDLMEKIFTEILHSIGESFSSEYLPMELVTELVYLYRTIMSRRSAWQLIGTNYVLDSIQSNLNVKSFQSNGTLVASLCILGRYIEHIGLTSIVRVSNEQQMSDESRLAMIMEINSDSSSCSIQYIDENQIESMATDRLEVVVQVPPPDLILLSSVNVSIDSILDAFGHFLQLNSTASESLMFLQLKRRSISALFHILQNQKMVEIFMNKPYASILAHLSMSEFLTTTNDLCYFDKEFLEQYSLRLDNYQRTKPMINDHEDTTIKFEQNQSSHQSLMSALSTPISKYNGWKPFASKIEIQMWKKGRIGNNNIKLIPFPIDVAKSEVFENCGQNHQFKGRIILKEEFINGRFPTFILENIQVTEGRWYFCVKLPTADLIQIGWATKGFTPICDSGIGIGDDDYSWSYDGSRGILFNNGSYRRQFDDIRWQKDDVCGCGIDIDGDNTNIKYWLNGKLLGTPFKHKEKIPQSVKKCNLFPHGRATSFFPGVTLKYRSSPTNYCEIIFSPEDMKQCPLPDGYKPLILPKLVNTENSLVSYPYHAYLLGDNQIDYLYTSRTMPSISLLRDFVNEDHLATEFQIDDHGLLLTKDSNGFPLTIDKDASSFTIAYDFQLSQTANEMQIITLVMTNNFSIQIPLKKSNQTTRVVMIGNINEEQIKVYWNNQNQTFHTPFANQTTNQLTLHHLPKIASGIKNIAVWNYALSEDHIHRLFTNGLFYVILDYQQLQEYRKRINTFSFTEKQFSDKTLIPFDQTFNENIWQINKNQANKNEAKFFSSEHPSTIQLVGNKTYLVLEKPIEPWSEYTIILDLSINKWPVKNEQWSIIQLNEKSRIYVTHEGKVCFKIGQTKKESDQTLNLNEYYRLWIIVKETSCHIFINGILQIDVNVKDTRLIAQSNRFYLFQEKESTNNKINENIARIRCQSITFLNRSTTVDEQMKTPNSSLESLVTPPLSIITPILIAMGHQSEWIEYVIEQYKTTKISTIDRILREEKQQMENNVLDNKNKQFLEILSTLSPTIDQQKLKDFISTSKFYTLDQLDDIDQFILTHWEDLQQTELIEQQNERFYSLTSGFDLKKWIHNSSTITSESNAETQIEDRNHPDIEHSSSSSSSTEDEESEDDESSSSSSVLQNGQRVNSDDNGMIVYRLHDLSQEQHKELIYFENQQRAMEYLQEEISSKQYIRSRIICEQRLTTIYARDTLLNILKVWSNNSTVLFPLDKFGDSTCLAKLFRLMFYYYTSTKEKTDYMSLLITSLLKIEIKQIIEQNLENKASLLCALQKDLFDQIMQFLVKPSSLNENVSDEETMMQQGNLKFIWKVFNIFIELIKDKSIVKQNEIEILLPLLFPASMIHLIFKLFMSFKTHQSKIVILRLFSNLIQMRNSFKLTEYMKHFLFKLLDELSSNEYELKLLRLSVMDIVFLLTEQDSESKRVQLPQNVRDLFITIDIINALTDQIKQMVVPEQFFIKSEGLLGEGMQISRDDFNKSNRYFDQTVDLQLIDLMNKSQKLKKSFSDFIRSLPTESVPDSTFYQNHPSLLSVPTDCVLIRAKVLYQFQLQIINVLSLLDLSLSPGKSFLTDQIRKAKIYIFSFKKHQLLGQSMTATESGYNHEKLHVRFDVLKAATADSGNNETTMFHQAYQQLYDKAQDSFRKKDKQIWKAQYINMHSTDQGGPYRDSITQMCLDICSTRLPLFILCPNGRTNSGSNQDCWIPNVFSPNKSIPEKLKKQYRFVGQLMGLAIRKKHYLNIKFAPLFWKELLCDPITIDDIQSIDSQSFTLIHEIEQKIEQAKSSDTNTSINYIFNSIFSELCFEVISSAQQTFELIPSGSQIPITAENFKEYSFHYRQYRLNEFHRQIDYIRQGLHSVVPYYYLNLFTENELEEAICGKGHIDVELLKRNTNYRHGYNQNSPIIERFWKVISEMFTEEQKKMLLVFAWGRSTLPVRDEDFTSKFIIAKFRVENDNVDQTLPLSHTCGFTIDLPEYSTAEIMYDRLNYAITHCSTIDGDGDMNVATANHEDSSSDYDSDDYHE